MLRFALAWTAMVIAQSIAKFVQMGGRVSGTAAYEFLVPLSNVLGLLLSAAYARFAVTRFELSLAVTETVAVVVYMWVGVWLQLPERLGSSLFATTPTVRDGAPAALRFTFMLVWVGIFMPLRPMLFSLVCTSMFVSSCVSEVVLGFGGLDTLLLYAVVYVLVALGRAHIMSTERSLWYFFRTVRPAMVARHQKERERMTQSLELTKGSIAKEARSRLIRVVMHDLRSPLLAVQNVAESFQLWLGPLLAADAKLVTGLSVLRSCSEMMETIVSDMLGARAPAAPPPPPAPRARVAHARRPLPPPGLAARRSLGRPRARL
jgi:signal transduction histidine kinase